MGRTLFISAMLLGCWCAAYWLLNSAAGDLHLCSSKAALADDSKAQACKAALLDPLIPYAQKQMPLQDLLAHYQETHELAQIAALEPVYENFYQGFLARQRWLIADPTLAENLIAPFRSIISAKLSTDFPKARRDWLQLPEKFHDGLSCRIFFIPAAARGYHQAGVLADFFSDFAGCLVPGRANVDSLLTLLRLAKQFSATEPAFAKVCRDHMLSLAFQAETLRWERLSNEVFTELFQAAKSDPDLPFLHLASAALQQDADPQRRAFLGELLAQHCSLSWSRYFLARDRTRKLLLEELLPRLAPEYSLRLLLDLAEDHPGQKVLEPRELEDLLQRSVSAAAIPARVPEGYFWKAALRDERLGTRLFDEILAKFMPLADASKQGHLCLVQGERAWKKGDLAQAGKAYREALSRLDPSVEAANCMHIRKNLLHLAVQQADCQSAQEHLRHLTALERQANPSQRSSAQLAELVQKTCPGKP